MKPFKPSEFLLACAEFYDAGEEIPPELRSRAPDGWHDYLALTLPEPFAPEYVSGELCRLRTLRFMLAAAMAADAGH